MPGRPGPRKTIVNNQIFERKKKRGRERDKVGEKKGGRNRQRNYTDKEPKYEWMKRVQMLTVCEDASGTI